MEIPKEVAILPLEEKEKYIIELRKQGKTYREIAKILKVSPVDISRTLRGVTRRDEITELKESVEEFKHVCFFAQVLGAKKRDACEFYKGEYCKFWHWERDDGKLKMRKERKKGKWIYRLNVKKHVEMCAFCYIPILMKFKRTKEDEE